MDLEPKCWTTRGTEGKHKQLPSSVCAGPYTEIRVSGSTLPRAGSQSTGLLNEQVREILVHFHNLLTPVKPVINVQQTFWISNRTSPQISKSCPRHRQKANRGDGNWAYFILAGWQSCHCNMFSSSAAHSSGRVNHDRLPLQSGLLYSIQTGISEGSLLYWIKSRLPFLPFWHFLKCVTLFHLKIVVIWLLFVSIVPSSRQTKENMQSITSAECKIAYFSKLSNLTSKYNWKPVSKGEGEVLFLSWFWSCDIF